jgi:hypothetical protein
MVLRFVTFANPSQGSCPAGFWMISCICTCCSGVIFEMPATLAILRTASLTCSIVAPVLPEYVERNVRPFDQGAGDGALLVFVLDEKREDLLPLPSEAAVVIAAGEIAVTPAGRAILVERGSQFRARRVAPRAVRTREAAEVGRASLSADPPALEVRDLCASRSRSPRRPRTRPAFRISGGTSGRYSCQRGSAMFPSMVSSMNTLRRLPVFMSITSIS